MATRIFQLVVLAALLVSPRIVQCQQAAAEVLTLEEAITLALRDNRQVKYAVLEVKKSEERLAAARTRRLPEFKFNALGSQLLSSIDFKFERGVFGYYPGIGPIPSEETVISTPRRPTFVMIGQVNQPLSQLYRIGLNLKQLDAGREIARQEVRAQQQAVIMCSATRGRWKARGSSAWMPRSVWMTPHC
jgi:outer membrane protein TolC